MDKGILLIISGPSGVGKGCVIKELVKLKGVVVSVSTTTRKPRETENNGVDYFFVSREEFLEDVSQNNMVEYNEFCGNLYGTVKSKLELLLIENEVVILEIDVNGAELVFKNMDCVRIFLLPPSFDELKRRLVERDTETKDSLNKRLKKAELEIKRAYEYDYVVVNDEIEYAVEKIKSIIISNKLLVKNKKFKIDEVLKK